MSSFADPRTLVEPTNFQLKDLKTHPNIVQYRALRDSLSKTLRDTYGTIGGPKGPNYTKCIGKLTFS